MKIEPAQPDIKTLDPDEHWERVEGNVSDISGGNMKSKSDAAAENPILASYFPALFEIHVSTLDQDEWEDEDIIDELVLALPHEFMHELLYIMGDNGELTGEHGVGYDISRQYDYFLHDVVDERGLHLYAWSDDEPE